MPLIGDSEMARLFGEETAAALAELDACNRQGQICSSCRGSCCRLVSCELYTPELSCCPVQKFRPVLCRMHFCHKFNAKYPLLVKEAGDIARGLAGTVSQAEKLLQMAEKGYEYGVKTRLEVEDAELNLSSARGNLARAYRDYRVAKVTLTWAMGVLGE